MQPLTANEIRSAITGLKNHPKCPSDVREVLHTFHAFIAGTLDVNAFAREITTTLDAVKLLAKTEKV